MRNAKPKSRSIRAILLILFVLAAASCGSGSNEGEAASTTQAAAVSTTETTVATTEAPTTTEATTTEATTTEAPTTEGAWAGLETVAYNNDFGASVAPILANRCASCHQPGGAGTAHWTLATADDAVHEASGIAAAVAVKFMPPWPASHESVPFESDMSLSDEEIAVIVDWVKAGAVLDVDPTTPIEATRQIGLADTDDVLTPAEPYAGSPAQTDDYRCLIYDPELTEQTALLGYQFVPDQGAVVHHAIGFLVEGASKQAALDKQAEQAGPGWQCYGGSGLSGTTNLLGWAPGQDASNYGEGAGFVMEAGDFFVIQIHYHYETEAPADLSALHVDYGSPDELTSLITIRQYVAPVEIPCTTEQSGPLCDRDAAMVDTIERFGTSGVRNGFINDLCNVTPADFADMTDSIVSSSCDMPIYGFGEIVSVLGHEHELGKSFRMTLNPDTTNEVVMLDIPVWDFDWQFNYRPVEKFMLYPGDTVRIECSWDRSLAKPGIEPAYILWADGTNDEMCFSTIVTREAKE